MVKFPYTSMRKILFLGEYQRNCGPSNVNRSLINYADDRMTYIKNKKKFFVAIEFFYKCIICNKILVSGIPPSKVLCILLFLRKDFFYIMHACRVAESLLNHQSISINSIKTEKLIFKHAKRIIAVSELYAEWFKEYYPQYKDKTTYVNNGIILKRRDYTSKRHGSIAVSGGNRGIKNNEIVCKAVERLNANGIPCNLLIFGRKYSHNSDLSIYPHAQYMGHLDKDAYYAELDKVEIFVLLSQMESFGLVVADALNCNCSLLLSKNVGALSIMRAEESDVVNNIKNIDEVCHKIEFLLKNGNSERLYRTIDVKKCTPQIAYNKIIDVCWDTAHKI